MKTRRAFLVGSLGGVGTLCGGAFAWQKAARKRSRPPSPGSDEFHPNPWIRIRKDGTVVLVVGRSEMGQGVRTALPMLLAEELEVDPGVVRLEQASPGPDYTRLNTGGSTSIGSSWLTLRQAGATAREALVAAAAKAWGVAATDCRAEKGEVSHIPTGRRKGYGELVELARALPPPKEPPLKKPQDFRVIGRARLRLDGPDIVTGRAAYSGDLRLPGLRFASIERCPVFGGSLKSFEAGAARQVPGVLDVVEVSSGVAVVATNSWAAQAGREALKVEWNEGADRAFSSTGFRSKVLEAATGKARAVREAGDPKAFETAAKKLEAAYEYPFEAHAALETLCAMARVEAGRCEIWAGTQTPLSAQRDVAARLGIPAESVVIHVALLGGGFGRRLATDFVVEAAELAQKLRQPVQVLWTRADDLAHDLYHPLSLHRMAASLEGRALASWRHTLAAPSILHSWSSGRVGDPAETECNGASDLPYRTGSLRVEYVQVPCPVPLGWWRGIQIVSNVFAREAFLDEVARAAGVDALDFRLGLLGEDRIGARLKAVLRLAAEKSDWRGSRPPGLGRGLACLAYDGRTFCAQVAEVRVGKGAFTVERVVCALDCGQVVNPLGLAGQVESGIVFGLSALQAEMTFEGGRAVQASYRDFPLLPLARMPKVEVHWVPSAASPSGAGEPPVPPVAPAVVNALFDATGKRFRRLPIRPEDLA